MDFDLLPEWRMSFNLNHLWFADTEVLEVSRNQGGIDKDILIRTFKKMDDLELWPLREEGVYPTTRRWCFIAPVGRNVFGHGYGRYKRSRPSII